MPYSYIPGSSNGDPKRAVKILLRFILYATLVGLVWRFLIDKSKT